MRDWDLGGILFMFFMVSLVAAFLSLVGYLIYSGHKDNRLWNQYRDENGCRIVGYEIQFAGSGGKATAWRCSDGKIVVRR